MPFATDRALYPVDRTGQLTGGYELPPRTMALRKSRWRDRRKAALVAVCFVALAVPYVLGLVVIYQWAVR